MESQPSPRFSTEKPSEVIQTPQKTRKVSSTSLTGNIDDDSSDGSDAYVYPAEIGKDNKSFDIGAKINEVENDTKHIETLLYRLRAEVNVCKQKLAQAKAKQPVLIKEDKESIISKYSKYAKNLENLEKE